MPDGKSIAVKDRNLRVFIWKTPFNESICYEVEKGASSRFGSERLNFLNGYRLTYDCNHGSIKIWNSKTNKEEFSIKTKISSVKSIAFNADNKTLAAGGEANDNYVDAVYLQVWDLINSTINEIPISDEYSHGDVVNSVTFSHDGQILVSAGKDKVVKIWNFE